MSASLSGRSGRADGFETLALADGTVVAVIDLGPRDAACTVVLHHGWTQDHTSWEDVAQLLAADLRVVSYDARGHGRSDAGPRGSATLEQLADDLAEVITRLVPEGPVVLAGHSLGGPVLLSFAERHPELFAGRVRGMALVATSAAFIGRDILGLPRRVTSPLLKVVPPVLGSSTRFPLRRTGMAPVLAQAIRTGLYGPGAATATFRRRTSAQVARSHPATVFALAAGLVDRDWRPLLDALASTPTKVLGGTHDALTPIAHSRAIAAALPTAELIVYRQAGHMLPYERATEVAEELRALASAEAHTAAS